MISFQLSKAQLWVPHLFPAPCLRRSGFRRSQRKVSVPHVQRGQIQPLSCEHLQCVMCSVAWSAIRVRADMCLNGEPLPKCTGVLCTEEVTERVQVPGQLALCAGKLLPAAERLAWNNRSLGRPVHFTSPCLVKVTLGPALRLPHCCSIVNTPRPVAAP